MEECHYGRVSSMGGSLLGNSVTMEGWPPEKGVSWGRVSTSGGCAVPDHSFTNSELDCVCRL